MRPRLGCVPFLNAKPLIAWFSSGNETLADVVFDDPSLLGPMVDRGEVDAAIASSFFAAQDPSFSVAAGVGISSRGAVRSVRLFSKVPFEEIEKLALDSASMTSNHLAQIVLHKTYGIKPICETQPANLSQMLGANDAAVLIGDAGMAADDRGLHVLDLGEAWQNLTGKPFVWAFWIGKKGLTDELATMLRRARDFGVQEISAIARGAAQEMQIPFESAEEYLTQAIDYDITPAHLEGFSMYGNLCEEMGFLRRFAMPHIVGETSATAGSS